MISMDLRWEYLWLSRMVLISDLQGGRTRQLCDQLADSGYMVIMPDFFRGEWRVSQAMINPWGYGYPYERVVFRM